ncbi:MAG: hypothetical protein Q6J78_04310, partial [Thermostichales cyanobacterium SRBZ-1_bins_19]
LMAPVWAATGQLHIEANGEDFIRQGFVSKDGWALEFSQVKLHFTQVSALQTDPPFNPDQGGSPTIKQRVDLPGGVVDLKGAEPVLLGTVTGAPPGFYNALSWQLTPTPELGGASLLLVGTATKGNVRLPFQIKVDQGYRVLCGEYIGEERRGILQPGGTARLEATFHFDHLFGDGEQDANDSLNQEALGFAPLAALAEGGRLEVTYSQVHKQLSPADAEKLSQALQGLAHTGEGHCRVEVLE